GNKGRHKRQRQGLEEENEDFYDDEE
uniref:Si:dkey-117n7.3 n=1 Tax=Xiphophorus maculatus TaxID=8083 RepID=A0A3B5REB5_XIPMA